MRAVACAVMIAASASCADRRASRGWQEEPSVPGAIPFSRATDGTIAVSRDSYSARLLDETVEVSLHDSRSFALEGRFELTKSGSLRGMRGNDVETLDAVPEGLEQQWHFTRSIETPTSVLVRLQRAVYASTDASGLHFVDVEGRPLLRYGHGKLRDAGGRWSSIPARWVDDHIELSLPVAECPCVLDPTITPEGMLSPGVPIVADGDLTSIAYGAGMYLVVFTDTARTVRYTRYSESGTALDPYPGVALTITPPAPGNKLRGRVAFDGSNFVVVRQEPTAIVARTIRPDGSAGADFTLVPSAATWTGLSAGGGVSMITYYAGSAFSFLRFRADGTMLDTSPRALGMSGVTITSNGSGFFVGGRVGSTPGGSYVANDGTVAWTKGFGTGSFTVSSVAYGPGGAALAGWTNTSGASSTWNTTYARVDTAGNVVGTTVLSNLYPVIGGNGSAWAIAYEQGADKWVARMDASGTLGTPTAVPLTGLKPRPSAVATSATQHLFLFEGLAAASVSTSTFALTGPFGIYTRPSAQSKIAFSAAAGIEPLVVWADDRGLQPQNYYGVRVSEATGATIDSVAKSLPLAGWGSPQGVFARGSHWFSSQATMGGYAEMVEIKPDLSVGVRAKVSDFMGEPVAVAWDGTKLAFFDSGMRIVRVVPGVTSTATPIRIQVLIESRVRLAANASRTVATYSAASSTCSPAPCESDKDVFVGGLNADDTLLAPTKVASGPAVQDLSDITERAGSFFVAYGERTAGAAAGALYLKRLFDTSATAVKVADVDTLTDVRLAADATGLDIVWADKSGVKIARAAGDVPAIGAPSVISTTPALEIRVAPLGAAKRALVLYRTGTQILQRVVSFGKDAGEACAAASECDSGVCVDGVCCSTACTAQCEACNLIGARGSCRQVTGSPVGSRPACSGAGVGTTCGLQCIADRSKCTYPATTTTCSKTACVGGVETHASNCNGAGSCNDVEKSCGGFACVGAVCGTSCSSKADCLSGYYCKDAKCLPLASLGAACASTSDCAAPAICTEGVCCEVDSCGPNKTCASKSNPGRCMLVDGQDCVGSEVCASGACVDGVCCDAACTEQCAACDLPGRRGKCSPTLGKPHGKRVPCASSAPDVCASRACDGVTTATCEAFTAKDTLCRARSCKDAIFVDDSKCDGAGVCVAPKESPCGGYSCASTTECRTSCASSAECAAGNSCDMGACVPVSSTCSEDGAFAENSKDRTRIACAPFRCDPSAGTCRSACANEADCADGLECSSSGKCEAPPAVIDEGGCASAHRSKPFDHASFAVFLVVGCVAWRRRPRHPRP